MTGDHGYTTTTIAMQVFTDQPLSLVVCSGRDKGLYLELSNKPVLIGTSSSSDMILTDKLVSPRHALLKPDGEWWILEDLDSENGCFLNGKLIKQSAVFPGERILLGNTELCLKYASNSDTAGLVKRRGEWVHIPRIISHELRNYLEFLDIGVKHLRRNALIEQQCQGEIKSLELAKDKMDELVQALRDGCIPPKKKRIDLTEILWEQASLLDTVSESSGIPVTWRIGEDSVFMEGDAGQIGRCLLNLIKNAIEACRRGDAVDVSLETDTRWIHLYIRDTGCGMNTETKESMWVPLYTTKENGTGMGAFIARTIVLRHDGTIDVVSEPGDGTTIHIRFPRYHSYKERYE